MKVEKERPLREFRAKKGESKEGSPEGQKGGQYGRRLRKAPDGDQLTGLVAKDRKGNNDFQ